MLPAGASIGDEEIRWFDASTSATVEVSSAAPGFHAAALVDRRTRGEATRVAWCAARDHGEWVRLSWRDPLVVRAVTLHAVRPDAERGTRLTIDRCRVRALRGGREVAARAIGTALSTAGTRVRFDPIEADAIEITIERARGTVERRAAIALAEVVTEARLPTDADASPAGSSTRAAQRGTMR